MKKLLTIAGVLVVLIAVVYSQRATIAGRLMEKGLEARMGADTVSTLEDGLHLALCVAGSPMPAPNASGPCVAVVAGKQLFTVDAGPDGPRNLARMGYQPGTVKGVFLTHFHSDHIDGLGEISTLRWAGGDNDAPLPVYGPRGVERVVDGFNTAYAQDFVYRHEHHGDLVAPMKAAGPRAVPFDKPATGELVVV
jgi:ribonuclease Z